MRPGALMLVLAALGAPVPALSQGLFRKADPLEVTITTGLGALIRDRDSTDRVTHGAELSYSDSSGKPVKLAITLRTRGHFRRQARNCEFPPLKVEMGKPAAARTVFEGNRTLKLVTNCRPSNADYEQYILQEYALYRIYQALTPWSYRTRLAHIAYRDSAGKAKPVDSWAFFVEDDGDLARRMGAKKFETTGAMFEHLEPTEFGYLQLFEYMSGNTDWSVSGLHNVTLMRDSIGLIHPVPYDFDWTGAVNARYSFPDKSLPISSVRDRLWRGDFRTADAMKPVIETFLARRPAMDSAYASLAAMTPAVKQNMRAYFAAFWTMLDKPANMVGMFKRTCLTRN